MPLSEAKAQAATFGAIRKPDGSTLNATTRDFASVSEGGLEPT